MRVCALLVSVILLSSIISILTFTPAYGIHQSSKMVWQIVVVSSEPVCTIFHYQLAQKYQIITEEYFKLYEFDSSRYHPDCYPDEKFDWKYEKPYDLDLLIIIYDRDLGREKLHSYEIGGLYSHTGSDITHNHTIIFCECSTFSYSDPSWILSHELSHFILNYLGFDLSQVEDQIHYTDYKYDYCMEKSYDDFCKSIGTYIVHEELGYNVKVMKPYGPAVGATVFEGSGDEIDFDSKGLELFKEITKWWHDGTITFTEYSASMKILTGENFEEISFGAYLRDSETLLLAEPSKETKIIPDNKENYVPNEILNSFSFIGSSTGQTASEKYPDWFKNRASMWTSGKISDEDFSKSISSLQNSVIPVDENPPLTTEELIENIKSHVINGQYNEGIELVDSAIENNVDSDQTKAELFLLKGTILYHLGQYSNALVFVDASLRINSGNVDAIEKKEQILSQLG